MHISHAKNSVFFCNNYLKRINPKSLGTQYCSVITVWSIKYKDHRQLEDGTTTRIKDGRQSGCPNIPVKDEFPVTSTSSPRIINHLSRLNFMLTPAFKFFHQKFHDFPITVSSKFRSHFASKFTELAATPFLKNQERTKILRYFVVSACL